MTLGAPPIPAAEAATSVDVKAAARAFAQTLAETEEYRAYESTGDRLRNDEAAQQVMAEFMERQRSLQILLQLNAVPPEDRMELERLRQAFLSTPTVAAHLKAQEDLTALCQAAADLLSQRVGLSFAAACGPGCC